ncbi:MULTISPECIES: hypothetical protein [Haloferax]|uniref:hypothetical protein n=1 Tax=Haloferax TaxID=2251 RepID=UPI0011C06BB3|nr:MULTISPECIES: hypothetical protein [Haloferax]
MLFITRLVYEYNSDKISHIDGIGLSIVLYSVGFISYWSFVGKKVITGLGQALFGYSTPSFTGSFSLPSTTLLDQIIGLYTYLPYSVLLGLILLGGTLSLRSKRLPSPQKSAIIVGLVFAVVSFPTPLDSLAVVQNLNFDRWALYTPVFIGIASASGLLSLFRRLDTQYKPITIVLVAVLVFSSLTNPIVASDSQQFSQGAQTPYLSKAEMSAVDFSSENTPGVVMSDYVVTRYLDPEQSHILIIGPQSRTPATGNTSHVILLRKNELQKRGLKLYPSEKYSYKPWYGRVQKTNKVHFPEGEFNKIYDNSNTTGYTRS